MTVLYVLRLLLLGLIDALGIVALVNLWSEEQWAIFAILTFGLIVTNIIMLFQQAYPLRYIFPGLLFFAAFVVYPMFYTVYLSFTNLSVGHLLTKEQVIAQLQGKVVSIPNAPRFNFWAYANEEGIPINLILQDNEGHYHLINIEEQTLDPIDATDRRLSDPDGDNVFDQVNGFTLLEGRDLLRQMSTFENLVFPFGEDVVKVASRDTFTTAKRQFQYDPQTDQLLELYRFNQSTNTWEFQDNPPAYEADGVQGFFVDDAGEVLTPGWQVWVGFDNYLNIFRNPRIMAPFLEVFGWTITFALVSVLLTFALGLFLAILLNDKSMKFSKFYRGILILPWAIPAFISIMVWRGLLNPVGPANLGIPWFTDPTWAKTGLILLNLWLGFPYMMTIALGALQSIPSELYEAAYVDGASRWKQFWRITFPLLLVSVGPLLVGSFAFNFNNFNVIFLFTAGGPPIPEAQTPAGATDILISYTYQVAFNGGWGQQYGFASAITIGIFLLVATISAINFKFTGALEEVGKE